MRIEKSRSDWLSHVEIKWLEVGWIGGHYVYAPCIYCPDLNLTEMELILYLRNPIKTKLPNCWPEWFEKAMRSRQIQYFVAGDEDPDSLVVSRVLVTVHAKGKLSSIDRFIQVVINKILSI